VSNVKSLLTEFEKQYKTPIGWIGMGDDDPPRLRSGIFAFDLASGGGFPMGRISLIYGPEASMKTTLALKTVAQAQRDYPKKRAVFVDVEAHLTTSWATKMGIDCEKLAYVLPDSAEQMVDVVEGLMYASDVSVIVVDSLAALVTKHELKSEAEKANVGGTGLLINKFYRKMSRVLTLAKREGVTPTLICINQIRSKIGGMYANAETMPGGWAFKFASSMSVRTYGSDVMFSPEKATEAGVNPAMPVYKEIKFTIKKYKVPIVAPNGVFLLALQSVAKPPLVIGDSYDWNTVLSNLKAHHLLLKNEGGGWDVCLGGEFINFDKQDALKHRMGEDPAFNAAVKSAIVEAVLGGE
jgi:protein RecA